MKSSNQNNSARKIFYFWIIFIFLWGIASVSKIAQAAESAQNFSSLTQSVSEENNRFQYLGWWGQANNNSVPVFAEPALTSKKLGVFSKANRVKVLEEVTGEAVGENSLWYKIDGGAFPGAYIFSGNITPISQPEPPGKLKIPAGVKPGDYWIDTDLTKQILTLFLYDTPVLATYASTGRVGNGTVTGTFRVYYKLSKTRMRGRLPYAPYRYDLKDVPYTMYYKGSYGIHGTYWHDKFGTRQSSGCTNLTQGDAKYIFDLVGPRLDGGVRSIFSGRNNIGTVVYNHY